MTTMSQVTDSEFLIRSYVLIIFLIVKTMMILNVVYATFYATNGMIDVPMHGSLSVMIQKEVHAPLQPL